jgi:hypothetical protein
MIFFPLIGLGITLKNTKGFCWQVNGSPVKNYQSFENQCKVGNLQKRLLATGVTQMACTACLLKEHFTSYRLVPSMFNFFHFTGIASLGKMCLKTPFSQLIFSVRNGPIELKFLSNNM